MNSNTRFKNEIGSDKENIPQFGHIHRDQLRLAHFCNLKKSNSFKTGERLFSSRYSSYLVLICCNAQQTPKGIGYSECRCEQPKIEITDEIWISFPFNRKIVFDMPDKKKIIEAANSLVIDFNFLFRRNFG